MTDIKTIALLTNPAAGHGRALKTAAEAKARFEERGATVQALVPTSADEASDLAGAAVSDGVDAIVVVGGDGMIHLTLPAIVGTDTPLGVIPAGTGNDQAREYGWPRDAIDKAVSVVLQGKTRRVDVGEATTGDGRKSYFGSVLAAGFDSLVSDRTNRMRWPHGRARYNLAILAEFVNLRPLPMKARLADGTVIDDDLLLIAVGNTRSYGGGMLICPAADPTDGVFDVTVGAAISRRTALMQMPSIYKGTHVDRPEVSTYRTTELTIEAPGINAYADGEFLGPLPATIRVIPQAASVIVP